MTCLPLYLASASPRRSQLLTHAGIIFEQLLAPIDEDTLSESYTGPLERLGEYLAREKALAALRLLAQSGRQGRVLASDTTVLLEGRSLAKPRDLAEAEAMLRMLRGREHIVATGVALAGDDPEWMVSATSVTRVLMRDYSDDEIAAYVATGDPLDKAGAYSIQHPDFSPVARFAGCHLGVIGLPLCLVGALLDNWPCEPSPTGEGKVANLSLCPWSDSCREPLPPATAIRRSPLKAVDTP
ncbi:MAG TPA: Maf family protein [Ktedonobacterales bacterium]|nr:Maf family protein [Ktedonobacterales bacterium]